MASTIITYWNFIKFDIDGGNENINVFTTRPDTIFGASFLAVSVDHPICKNFVNDELPFIHGNVDIKNFLKLIKKLEINEFKLHDFNHFYFFKSKRLDLVYKDKITIKLPINDLNNSIILLKQIFEKSNLNEIKIIDLRLKNKIIMS